MPKTIHDLLSKWGISKRVTPPHNETLKQALLDRPVAPLQMKQFSQARLPWLSIACAGLALIALVIRVTPSTLPSPVPMGVSEGNGSVQLFNRSQLGLDSLVKSIAKPDYYPYPQPGGDITDSREFLKTAYSASIRIRHVSNLAQTIRNIIRGSNGRVDSMNVSDKTGYLNFAVPADKFDVFQSQIQGLVGSRYITETINTQNLLPQKQSIEQQQEDINQKLSASRNQRAGLMAQHNRTIASLQVQLQNATSDQERIQINAQIAAEQASYHKQLAALNAQISDYTAMLTDVNKQNTQLLNNVATVNGSISLQWISVWEILDLYAGPYWFPILLAIAAILAYVNHRRKEVLLPL